jgi:hypothetical protein
MFGHFEKIDYVLEAALARKIRSYIVDANRRDRVDFNLAPFHSVSPADGNARLMPYADAAGNRARPDAIAQVLLEEHVASLTDAVTLRRGKVVEDAQ